MVFFPDAGIRFTRAVERRFGSVRKHIFTAYHLLEKPYQGIVTGTITLDRAGAGTVYPISIPKKER